MISHLTHGNHGAVQHHSSAPPQPALLLLFGLALVAALLWGTFLSGVVAVLLVSVR